MEYPVPVKFWHCKDDSIVAYDITEKIVNIIKSTKREAQLHPFATGGHEPQLVGEILEDPCGINTFCGDKINITPAVEEAFIWIKSFDKSH